MKASRIRRWRDLRIVNQRGATMPNPNRKPAEFVPYEGTRLVNPPPPKPTAEDRQVLEFVYGEELPRRSKAAEDAVPAS